MNLEMFFVLFLYLFQVCSHFSTKLSFFHLVLLFKFLHLFSSKVFFVCMYVCVCVRLFIFGFFVVVLILCLYV